MTGRVPKQSELCIKAERATIINEFGTCWLGLRRRPMSFCVLKSMLRHRSHLRPEGNPKIA